MSWTLVYTKQAQRDAKKLSSFGLRANAERLLALLAQDPFKTPPPYESLVGNLKGALSRRINIQHRLVYQVLPDEHIVKVLRVAGQSKCNCRQVKCKGLIQLAFNMPHSHSQSCSF